MSTYFDPENFLKLANEIQKFSTEFVDALHRTVIGRSYYSAFLIGKRILIERKRCYKLINMREGVHEEVIKQLSLVDTTIFQELDALRELRIFADYHCEVCLNNSAAERALKLAQRVINRIRTSVI